MSKHQPKRGYMRNGLGSPFFIDLYNFDYRYFTRDE